MEATVSLSPVHPEEDTAPVPADTATPFIVGLFFSFRLFIMLLSVRAFGMEPQTGTEISIALNLFLLGVVAFQSIGAADRTFGSILKISSVRWVSVFILFSGCSLFWSVAASLAAAAAYWCAMVSDVLMLALILRGKPTAPIVHSLMKGYVGGACIVAIIAWILPGQSDLRLGDDELLGANQIGYLCAFAFFFAQYLMLQKTGKWGMAAFLLAVTLLRSLSKTTIFAFLIAEGFLLMRDKFMSRRTKLIILSSTAFVGLAFSGLLTSYFDLYTNTGNSPETLTGRLGIWAFLLEEAVQQPWIGHGFYSVWKVIPPFGEFEARHAHNEIIQQFYSYGVSGLCMMAGLYVSFYRHVRRHATGSVRTFYVALLLFVLIRGFADTEIFDFSLPLWAILMFSVLLEQEHDTTGPSIAASVPYLSPQLFDSSPQR
jgi:exopolysaccharide production protein ExoQ